MALPKSTLVRRVDELGKEWQGDFGRLVFLSIFDIAIALLLPYLYKIVLNLFSNNTSI